MKGFDWLKHVLGADDEIGFSGAVLLAVKGEDDIAERLDLN